MCSYVSCCDVYALCTRWHLHVLNSRTPELLNDWATGPGFLAPVDPRVERTFLGPSGDFSVHLLTRAHPQHQVVKEHFLQKWKKHVSGQPRVQRIYFIRNSPQVHEAFSAVASRIGNVRRRFHGTSQAPGCNFGKNPSTPPCDSSDCRICSIAHHSFRTRCSGQTTASQNGGWLRYGRGLYFSATSGKSNDYSAGSETIRREGDRRGKDWRWRCM